MPPTLLSPWSLTNAASPKRPIGSILPHTACGFKAFEEIKAKFPNTPCVLCSTAEWTKFAPTLAKALGLGDLSDKEALESISKTYKVTIPKQIFTLFNQPEIHNQVFDKETLSQKILEWL